MSIDIGQRLHDIRKIYGLSQRALAKRANVTNGTISLIEKNRVSPSISSLQKVLDAIPISMTEFFTKDFSAADQVFFNKDELPDVGSGGIAFNLVGHTRNDRAMSVLHEVYEPGADTGKEMLSHTGEEGGVVVSGQIEITIGKETRVLGPGDGYYFDCPRQHRFRNTGKGICVIVSAHTPPSF